MGMTLDLQLLVAKIKAKKAGEKLVVKYVPVDYAKSDRLAAKNVLDRLLATNREVSYIREVPIQIEEE